MQVFDFLVDKYKKLLYLKKHKSFLKGFRSSYSDSREKKF